MRAMIYLAAEQAALTLCAALVCLKTKHIPEPVVFVYGLATLCNVVTWRRLNERTNNG